MIEHTFNAHYWCERCGNSYQEVRDGGITVCRRAYAVDNARAIAWRMKELEAERRQPEAAVEPLMLERLVDAWMRVGVTP